jgi:Flp pilus assembly protein TadD
MGDMKIPDGTDFICCRAAQGWIELGNAAEAEKELDAISPELHSLPDVRKVRWRLQALAHRWADALATAEGFAAEHPDEVEAWVQRSFALHELKRTPEARDNLRSVVGRFPNDAIVRYNLGCYECQLGNLKAAEEWLFRAFQVGNGRDLKVMALEDPDYQPLWERIRAME